MTAFRPFATLRGKIARRIAMSRKELYGTTATGALKTAFRDVETASDANDAVGSRFDEKQEECNASEVAARQKAYDGRHKANIEAAIRATAAPKVATKFLYTTSEARAALGCGITRLYELINNGTLDARRFGRRTYIRAESLESFVASLKPVVTPTTAKAAHDKWSAQRRARPKPRKPEPAAASAATTA
jgi:excisionase family DNA binding protein